MGLSGNNGFIETISMRIITCVLFTLCNLLVFCQQNDPLLNKYNKAFSSPAKLKPFNEYVFSDINGNIYYDYYKIINAGYDCLDIHALAGFLVYNKYDIPIKLFCKDTTECIEIYTNSDSYYYSYPDSIPFTSKSTDKLSAIFKFTFPIYNIYNQGKTLYLNDIRKKCNQLVSDYNDCIQKQFFDSADELARYIYYEDLTGVYVRRNFDLISGLEDRKRLINYLKLRFH